MTKLTVYPITSKMTDTRALDPVNESLWKKAEKKRLGSIQLHKDAKLTAFIGKIDNSYGLLLEWIVGTRKMNFATIFYKSSLQINIIKNLLGDSSGGISDFIPKINYCNVSLAVMDWLVADIDVSDEKRRLIAAAIGNTTLDSLETARAYKGTDMTTVKKPTLLKAYMIYLEAEQLNVVQLESLQFLANIEALMQSDYQNNSFVSAIVAAYLDKLKKSIETGDGLSIYTFRPITYPEALESNDDEHFFRMLLASMNYSIESNSNNLVNNYLNEITDNYPEFKIDSNVITDYFLRAWARGLSTEDTRRFTQKTLDNGALLLVLTFLPSIFTLVERQDIQIKLGQVSRTFDIPKSSYKLGCIKDFELVILDNLSNLRIQDLERIETLISPFLPTVLNYIKQRGIKTTDAFCTLTRNFASETRSRRPRRDEAAVSGSNYRRSFGHRNTQALERTVRDTITSIETVGNGILEHVVEKVDVTPLIGNRVHVDNIDFSNISAGTKDDHSFVEVTVRIKLK